MNLSEHFVGRDQPPKRIYGIQTKKKKQKKHIKHNFLKIVKKKKTIGPTDIEGHRGRDNRYYMIDFARLFPPEPRAKDEPPKRGRHL